jgi:hypothetical protein
MPVKEFLPQLTLTATVKENNAGGETLSFIVPMGPLQIICIANIPGEGEREAPAYVKFKLDTRATQDFITNRPRRPRFNGDGPPQRRPRYDDDREDEGYDEDYPQGWDTTRAADRKIAPPESYPGSEVAQMKITHCDKITSFLTMLAKQKQLKVARPLAIFSTSSCTSTAEEFVKILSATYPGLPDLTRGVATKSGTSFYFVDSEEEVLRKLEMAKKDLKKGKTAPKVLVSMIYTRIVKIQNQIDAMEDSVQQMTSNQVAGHQSWAHNWVKPVITRETLTTRDQLISSNMGWAAENAQNDLINVATRPDVTEEIFDQAWALWEAYTIMQS